MKKKILSWLNPRRISLSRLFILISRSFFFYLYNQYIQKKNILWLWKMINLTDQFFLFYVMLSIQFGPPSRQLTFMSMMALIINRFFFLLFNIMAAEKWHVRDEILRRVSTNPVEGNQSGGLLKRETAGKKNRQGCNIFSTQKKSKKKKKEKWWSETEETCHIYARRVFLRIPPSSLSFFFKRLNNKHLLYIYL